MNYADKLSSAIDNMLDATNQMGMNSEETHLHSVQSMINLETLRNQQNQVHELDLLLNRLEMEESTATYSQISHCKYRYASIKQMSEHLKVIMNNINLIVQKLQEKYSYNFQVEHRQQLNVVNNVHSVFSLIDETSQVIEMMKWINANSTNIPEDILCLLAKIIANTQSDLKSVNQIIQLCHQ